MPARIVLVERLGGSSLVHMRVEGIETMLTAEVAGIYSETSGLDIHLSINPDRVHVFDTDGRTI